MSIKTNGIINTRISRNYIWLSVASLSHSLSILFWLPPFHPHLPMFSRCFDIRPFYQIYNRKYLRSLIVGVDRRFSVFFIACQVLQAIDDYHTLRPAYTQKNFSHKSRQLFEANQLRQWSRR